MAINYDLNEQKRVACISNELARASMMFDIAEFRILFNVISLINPEGNELQSYDFTFKEISHLTDTIKSRTSIGSIRKMLSKTITKSIVLDKNKAKAFTPIIGYDSTDISKIRISFNEAIKEHVLLMDKVVNVDENGVENIDKIVKKSYAKIDMKIFNTLKSANAMRLYIYLKSYQALRKTPTVSVNEMKFIFKIEEDIDIGKFNRNFLTRAIDEINKKTDIAVIISKEFNGKMLTGYKFTIGSSKKEEFNTIENNGVEESVLKTSEKNEKELIDSNDDNKKISSDENKDYSAFINIAKIALGMQEKDIVRALISCGYDENKAYDKLSKSITA